MIVTVLSPDRELFNGEAKSVKVPGKDGGFEILNGHAPILSSLVEGSVIVDGKIFEIATGIVEVLNNEVSVLVEQ